MLHVRSAGIRSTSAFSRRVMKVLLPWAVIRITQTPVREPSLLTPLAWQAPVTPSWKVRRTGWPGELARVDALLEDPAFFAPFAPHFDPVLGRPSTPVECYLRLVFLKFRYRLSCESLCAEVSDSISWRRFCRIPLEGRVPHPTTLMKLTTRCGEAAVAGLNEALWAKAAGQKLLRTARVRADTTVTASS